MNIKKVELTDTQKEEALKRIDMRLNGELNLNLKSDNGKNLTKINDIKANEVDFSIEDNDSVLGVQYIIKSLLQNDESVDLVYSEVENIWLYNLIKEEKNKEEVQQEFSKLKSSTDYKPFLNYLEKNGYKIALDSRRLLISEHYSFNKETQKSAENQNETLVIDIYEQDENSEEVNITGNMIFDEEIAIQFSTNIIIFINGKPEVITLDNKNERLEDITLAKSGGWRACMGNCLGCGSWDACLSKYGCLANCAACASPINCAVCIACVGGKVSCLWTCRMCVPGAARPEECPV